ncbi:MAG: hypothetical protein HZB83_03610 [Deltaproteobacteria bacterium]|nr:hypothetical protein [Deltaproteobacteria bacterium]
MALVLLPLILTLSGCVSKGTYDRDVGTLAVSLERERALGASRINELETKLSGRGKTMSELTERYATLQKDREKAQMKFNMFRPDVEGLIRDIEQLRLMVYANAKNMLGSSGSEMIIKLTGMERTLKEMLIKDSATAPPPAN